MEVLLTIYSDEKEYFSREVALPCVIGRGKQCDVTIVHPLVSRRHCEIYEENGVVMMRDLGSLNGTLFQGVRIGRGVAIPSGSFFSIGRLMLRVTRLDGHEDNANATNASPFETEIPEIVDVDRLISDSPAEGPGNGVNPGGDSSVIDLEKYLRDN